MKIFLSYPSAERRTAERMALALEAEGHEVFFDRSDLAAGEAFHQRLREAIERADAMVFLVTPAAVAPGSYALAELDIARTRWRRPAGRVLPVMLEPTPVAALPPFLSAVTLLQPHGDVVAATVAAVARLAGRDARSSRRRAFGALAAAALAAIVAVLALQWQQRRETAEALQRDQAAGERALQLCQDGSHEAALQQLEALAARKPPAPQVAGWREDCAMSWLREMRATRSEQGTRSFDQQVAVALPVLLQGLAGAAGARAADLRAHIGWGEYLRRREGSGSADPVPHWQRALADDAGNVYAHAMWGHTLLPTRLAQARRHFDEAAASGRDRGTVRRLQFGGALGGGDDAAAYAVAVADEIRRAGEPLAEPLRLHVWNQALGLRLLDPEARQALFAALPAADLLATFEWLVAGTDAGSPQHRIGRFARATLQLNAGQHAAARSTFAALESELHAARQGGRLLEQTQRALAESGRP